MNQVAKLLRVHVATIWRWVSPRGVRGRRLKTVLIGGRRYVLKADLDKFLTSDEEREHESTDAQQRAKIAANMLDAHGVKAR